MRLRRGGHDPRKSITRTRRRWKPRTAPLWFWPTPSKATGWARRARPQHHPPAEEAQRAGAGALPVALRVHIPEEAARHAEFLPAALGQPGNGLPARAAAPAGWIHAEPLRGGGKIEAPPLEYLKSRSKDRPGRVSSTMAFVRVLTLLMKHPQIGHRVVRSSPTKRARSAWNPCSASSASMPARTALQAARRGDVPVLQGIQGRPEFSKRASPRPVPWLPLRPRARPTRTTARL